MYEKISMATSRANNMADANPDVLVDDDGVTGVLPIPQTGFGVQGLASSKERIGWLILLSALALTVLEGAIRKWLIESPFETWSYIAYFSKDIVFGLLLLLPPRRALSPALDAF